jgi:arylsulfatase A
LAGVKFFSLALLFVIAGLAHAAPEKPNIIFILADDIGLPGFGCTGGVYKTPNIDALAASGTRFEYCYAAPLCAPSRAMLMTGRYAFRTGVRDNGSGAQATPQKDGCVAQLMKQAGYATGVAGKWGQLTYFKTKEDGAKWGFDEFLIWGAGDPEEGEGAARGKKTSRYWDPGYNRNGEMLPETKGQYGPDVLQAFALDFIRRHQEGPFFLYYPTPLIHSPIQATPDSTTGNTAAERKRLKQGGKKGNGYYADNIAYLDKQVGQIVAELEKLHLREKTLIVFTGDNGSVPVGMVNGRPVNGRKSQVNEGGSRVPLIASWPGVTTAGKVLPDLTDFTDLLPTFAELAGVKVPADRKIDGHSLAPQLRGEAGTPRDWVYVQLREDKYVRSRGWKLTGKGELFDMKDAPWQELAVPVENAAPEAAKARADLQAVLEGVKDSFVPVKMKKGKKAKA